MKSHEWLHLLLFNGTPVKDNSHTIVITCYTDKGKKLCEEKCKDKWVRVVKQEAPFYGASHEHKIKLLEQINPGVSALIGALDIRA